jgi:hypothetical protein
MPSPALIAKILLLMGITVTASSRGVLGYYHNHSIEEVCRYRNQEGWNHLACSWPCQIASIDNHVGEYWLIALPNCRGQTEYRLCLVVDCAAEEDKDALRNRGEVAEISGELAQYCGYQGYVEGAQIWKLEERKDGFHEKASRD